MSITTCCSHCKRQGIQNYIPADELGELVADITEFEVTNNLTENSAGAINAAELILRMQGVDVDSPYGSMQTAIVAERIQSYSYYNSIIRMISEGSNNAIEVLHGDDGSELARRVVFADCAICPRIMKLLQHNRDKYCKFSEIAYRLNTPSRIYTYTLLRYLETFYDLQDARWHPEYDQEIYPELNSDDRMAVDLYFADRNYKQLQREITQHNRHQQMMYAFSRLSI